MWVRWTQTQSSKPSQIILNKEIESWKLGREFAFRRYPLSGVSWKRCARAFPLSCTTLKRKQSLWICLKALFGRVLLLGAGQLEDPSGSQQAGHEKGNWCDQARKCSQNSSALGTSDSSVESALNKAEWLVETGTFLLRFGHSNIAGEQGWEAHTRPSRASWQIHLGPAIVHQRPRTSCSL